MKIAVITGASSGMGREFVRQIPHFYMNLDELWIISRRKDRLEAIAKTCSVPVRIFAGDLTDPMFLQTVKDTLKRLRPDIRMLVNAAGFGKSGTVLDIAKEEWPAQSEMVRLNCEALTNMTLLCAPYLSQGSRILQIASAAAFAPQPQFAVYAATKSYVLSFSRALGAEWKKKGIYVTAVCPGPVDTEFFERCGQPENPLKKMTMAKAPNVVKQALLDARRKKAVSIFGFWMRALYILVRIVPVSWILNVQTIGKK